MLEEIEPERKSLLPSLPPSQPQPHSTFQTPLLTLFLPFSISIQSPTHPPTHALTHSLTQCLIPASLHLFLLHSFIPFTNTFSLSRAVKPRHCRSRSEPAAVS